MPEYEYRNPGKIHRTLKAVDTCGGRATPGTGKVADKELRETYGSLAFITSRFMNHVDLFKTLNLIKGSKGKVKFMGYRGNSESREENAVEGGISERRLPCRSRFYRKSKAS